MPFNEKGEWRPHKKQSDFLSIPWSIKEAAYLGGAGSAKSETLLVYPLAHKLHENPRFKQVFMRRTFPELRNEIIPRAKILYKPFGGEFNKSDMVFEFPLGARIYMGHCENEDDVRKYDSMEINLFTPDEITSFSEYIYLYIAFTRVRAPVNSGLPAIIRCAGMPGGPGHAWVKKRFVDPCPKGGKIIIGRGNNKRIMIFATQADNPYIDPEYKQSLEALPEAEKQAKLHGSFDAYLGQVFDEFRDRHYPDEPENALHVIEPFDIPAWWPRIVVGDWGYAAMTWIGFGAISPDKRLYVYRELAFTKTKIEEWAAILKPYIESDAPRVIKFCKSAGQDRGQEHTIQQQIEEALNHQVSLSNNSAGSRVAGKALLHEYLRWKPKFQPTAIPRVFSEEHSMWILRNRGMKEYDSYLQSFAPTVEEKDLPKIQIFNNCPLLIQAIKSCIYAKSSDGKPAEDVAEFDGDDPYDAIRYMVDTADKYFDDSANEFEKLQKRQTLLAKLANQQDWTAFYRNAAMLDIAPTKAVKRYHGRRS